MPAAPASSSYVSGGFVRHPHGLLTFSWVFLFAHNVYVNLVTCWLWCCCHRPAHHLHPSASADCVHGAQVGQRKTRRVSHSRSHTHTILKYRSLNSPGVIVVRQMVWNLAYHHHYTFQGRPCQITLYSAVYKWAVYKWAVYKCSDNMAYNIVFSSVQVGQRQQPRRVS